MAKGLTDQPSKAFKNERIGTQPPEFCRCENRLALAHLTIASSLPTTRKLGEDQSIQGRSQYLSALLQPPTSGLPVSQKLAVRGHV
jgi:hypothetical protein